MGVYFASASTCPKVSHQYVYEKGLFQMTGRISWLFKTSILQIIKKCILSTVLGLPGDLTHRSAF